MADAAGFKGGGQNGHGRSVACKMGITERSPASEGDLHILATQWLTEICSSVFLGFKLLWHSLYWDGPLSVDDMTVDDDMTLPTWLDVSACLSKTRRTVLQHRYNIRFRFIRIGTYHMQVCKLIVSWWSIHKMQLW